MSWSKSLSPLFEKLVTLSRELSGEKVFYGEYSPIVAIDFGHISTRRFFDALRCLAKCESSERLVVATVEPDPKMYYEKHFKAFPTFEITAAMSAQEYLDELHWGPAVGGADSIACHAERIAIMAETMSWILIGEREEEVARLFARNTEIKSKLLECIPIDWRY